MSVPSPSPSQRAASAGTRLWLLAIILLAFALRLVQLGSDSLWYDETVSVFLAGRPTAELIAHTARDIHPPGYYLLLRAWLVGSGYPTGQAGIDNNGLEFIAAFLSLFFGVLLVPLTWQLARRLGLGQVAARLAALLIAISPFAIWYGQEVRMYTLGASLGVLCLLATLPFLASGNRRRLAGAAAGYALAAAAGLYTLYYFAFLLGAVNLLLVPLLAWRWLHRRSGARTLALWLAAQAAALLLYLPWLSIAWRQATDPPVPPWRTSVPLVEMVVESWGALSLGQSADLRLLWPLLVLTLVLCAVGVAALLRGSGEDGKGKMEHPSSILAYSQNRQAWVHSPSSSLLLLTAAFGPALLIFLASQFTPLYHVRYLFTFAPAFSVLVAAGLAAVGRWRVPMGRWLMAGALVVLVIGSALSLRALWRDPQFAADDHRAAVRELAERWRPGDAILVNAGYAYPALLTYWPGDVSWRGRLSDYQPDPSLRAPGAVILQAGHVDGDANLGWGDPRSDFYALPAPVMAEKLAEVAKAHSRLWHYRIYDTVNDPAGLIRAELDRTWDLFDDRVYGGEANLRVQGLLGPQNPLPTSSQAQIDGWLDLHVALDELPVTGSPHDPLDLPFIGWRWAGGAGHRPVALSLRLVDDAGAVWAQGDEPLGGNQTDFDQPGSLFQPLRLAVPAGTAPGAYRLALVVYDRETGRALPITDGPFAGHGAIDLGGAVIERPASSPALQLARADFGPLRLVEASTPARALSPGDAVPLSLLWQAAPDFDGEELVVVVQLLDADGAVAAGLEEEPLAGRHPTSAWQAGELVRDRHELAVPEDTTPGPYQVIVGLYTLPDRIRLSTGGGLLGGRRLDHFVVQDVVVQ